MHFYLHQSSCPQFSQWGVIRALFMLWDYVLCMYWELQSYVGCKNMGDLHSCLNVTRVQTDRALTLLLCCVHLVLNLAGTSISAWMSFQMLVWETAPWLIWVWQFNYDEIICSLWNLSGKWSYKLWKPCLSHICLCACQRGQFTGSIRHKVLKRLSARVSSS